MQVIDDSNFVSDKPVTLPGVEPPSHDREHVATSASPLREEGLEPEDLEPEDLEQAPLPSTPYKIAIGVVSSLLILVVAFMSFFFYKVILSLAKYLLIVPIYCAFKNLFF